MNEPLASWLNFTNIFISEFSRTQIFFVVVLPFYFLFVCILSGKKKKYNNNNISLWAQNNVYNNFWLNLPNIPFGLKSRHILIISTVWNETQALRINLLWVHETKTLHSGSWLPFFLSLSFGKMDIFLIICCCCFLLGILQLWATEAWEFVEKWVKLCRWNIGPFWGLQQTRNKWKIIYSLMVFLNHFKQIIFMGAKRMPILCNKKVLKQRNTKRRRQ